MHLSPYESYTSDCPTNEILVRQERTDQPTDQKVSALVVTVNNILNVYKRNPNYYCSVSCGIPVTFSKDLLERETPLCAVLIFEVTEGCNF